MRSRWCACGSMRSSRSGLSDQHRDHLAVGAPIAFWDGFLLQMGVVAARQHPRYRRVGEQRAVGRPHPAADRRHARSRRHVPPDAAARPRHRASVRRGIRAGDQRAGQSTAQLDRLCVRRLGARISSRTTPPPTRSSPTPVSISTWARSASTICSTNECSGYFPSRLVRSHLARGRLRQPKRARKFVYPGLHGLSGSAQRGGLRADPQRAAGAQAAKCRLTGTRWRAFTRSGAPRNPSKAPTPSPIDLDASRRRAAGGPSRHASSIASTASAGPCKHRFDRAVAAIAHPAGRARARAARISTKAR